MLQIEGLYVVEFGDVAIGGQTYTYWNGGVAVLETNRIFGGDSGYYYVGNYTIQDSQFEATVKIVKHNPTWEDALKTDVEEVRAAMEDVEKAQSRDRLMAQQRKAKTISVLPR
jgi:hypothetical protein